MCLDSRSGILAVTAALSCLVTPGRQFRASALYPGLSEPLQSMPATFTESFPGGTISAGTSPQR